MSTDTTSPLSQCPPFDCVPAVQARQTKDKLSIVRLCVLHSSCNALDYKRMTKPTKGKDLKYAWDMLLYTVTIIHTALIGAFCCGPVGYL